MGTIVGLVFIIPFILIRHTNETTQNWLLLAAGSTGALFAWLKWRAANAGRDDTGDVHGSARWASEREVWVSLGGGEGLIVGRENRRNGQLLRYDGEQHLITIAPTRSGKGVGAIIPNLLTTNRSVLCIDPKGENARITLPARLRFGLVEVLDPFGASGIPSSSFNPLDGLDPDSLELAEDAALLADALVYDPPGQTGEAHWNEEAKALIAGVILHVVCSEHPSARNLVTVRDRLTCAPEAFDDMLSVMQKSRHAGGLVARAANRHLSKSGREAAGVLSSAQRHTHFLDSQRMAAVLEHSDFRFEDLKAGVCTVFLVLPPERLSTHARWLRLLVAQAIGALAKSTDRPDRPVLLLLDEFAALGRLEPLEHAFGLMAGYGLQLWPILQDLHQLRSVYGERAGTFLSNAGLIQIFNVGDVETASWVSRSMGSGTVAYRTASSGESQSPGPMMFSQTSTSTSTTDHLVKRELLTPDEVMRLDSSLEILLRQGQAPVAALKVRYFAEGEFRGLH
ncbi:type IV secretory system conjugative DNA transfer family protein [Brevundimonas sp. TSRC1-1]|uniref:type IV secretory system conjugative DNA transfer family protein n=1 Tax=Brevundimonas sp. TSRC1-1 TaxID=2804562 RepID=UPI003CEA444B